MGPVSPCIAYLWAFLSSSLQLTSLPTASLTAPHIENARSLLKAAWLGRVKYSRGDPTPSTINKEKEKKFKKEFIIILICYLLSVFTYYHCNVIVRLVFILYCFWRRLFCRLALFQDYDAQDLLDFEETILRGCDFNRDGKISKKELTMILLALSKHSQDDETKSK